MTTDDLEAVWADVFDALPAGWSVGRPSFYPERRAWQQYSFDSFEVPKVGVRPARRPLSAGPRLEAA